MKLHRRTSYFLALLFIASGFFFIASPASAAHISVTTAPGPGMVDFGKSISFVITTTCLSTCTTPIGFSITDLPADASYVLTSGGASFSSCIPTCSTVATITAGSTAGTFALTVLAGAETFTNAYTLTITDPNTGALFNYSWLQTDTTASSPCDISTGCPGFNTTGAATSSTQVTTGGSGTSGKVQLATAPFDDGDGSYAGSCAWNGGTIDSNLSPYNCPGNVTISGIVTVTGSVPLVIKAKGSVTVSGTLSLNGGSGSSSTAGGAVAGGGAGGNGSPGGYGYGVTGSGLGGGAGGGWNNSSGRGITGSGGTHLPNDASLATLVGGSGGGGGGTYTGGAAGGAGGGGGAVKITTNSSMSVSGTISANGGTGANSYGTYPLRGGGGGGGSGGAVHLSASSIALTGQITATGNIAGTGGTTFAGANGSDGRIRLDSAQTYAQLSALYANITPDPGYTTCSSGCNAGSAYVSPGTYISAVYDAGQNSDFTTVGWTSAIPSATTSIILDMRSGSLSSGTSCNADGSNVSFGAWQTGIATITTANQNSSASIATLTSNRCVRYRVNLATTDASVTPSLESVTVNWQQPGTFNFTTSLTSQSGAVAAGLPISPNPTLTATLTYPTAAGTATTLTVFAIDERTLPMGVIVTLINPVPASPCTMSSTQTCATDIIISTSQSACTSSTTVFCPRRTNGTLNLGATPAGNYVIPLTASVSVNAQTTLTKEATYTLTVLAPFTFSMAWTSPCAGASCTSPTAVTQGGSIANANFNVTKLSGSIEDGINNTVNLSVDSVSHSNISAGVPPSCAPTSATPCSVAATITVGTGTPAATQWVRIRGVSGSNIVYITLSFTVQKAYSFTIKFVTAGGADTCSTPPCKTLNGGAAQGGSAIPRPNIRIAYADGPESGLNYTVTPSFNTYGATGISTTPPTPSSCTIRDSSVTPSNYCDISFDVNVSSGATANLQYPIAITGASLATPFTDSVDYSLTVYGPFDFTMKFGTVTTLSQSDIPTADPQATTTGSTYQTIPKTVNVSLVYNASPSIEQITFSAPGYPTQGVSVSGLGASTACTTSSTNTSGGICYPSFTINTNDTTPTTGPGNVFLITLTGTSISGRVHTMRYTLTVNPQPISYNMRGWAWSDSVGWISFNAQNCDIDWDGVMDKITLQDPGTGDGPAPAQCPPDGTLMPNYGVQLDFSTNTHILSGTAWNNEIGWITFDRANAGTTDATASLASLCAALPVTAPLYYGCNSGDALARLDSSGKILGWARAISGIGQGWGWIKMSN